MKTKASRPQFHCTECGWQSLKWVGRCGECSAWGTVEEVANNAPHTGAASVPATAALPLSQIPADAAAHKPTGVDEFDRVLGGGIVPGSVVLLAGEPGVGKSTLLLEVAANVARQERAVLYVTGEESAAQVKLRAGRIDAIEDQVLLAAETDLSRVLGHVEAHDPQLLIVDSVQTISSGQIDGAAGGVAQVREVAAALIAAAKSRGVPVILVGHVTKDGGIAGPRVLEHLVDVVCHFEGDRHAQLRTVRAVKNRYGTSDEVGCFLMTEKGLTGLADPSGVFLSSAGESVPGSCVTISLDGRRPLPTQIQSLLAPTPATNPKRATQGVDSSRVQMMLAVLAARTGIDTQGYDVYVSTVGGARAHEVGADLAIALALTSIRGGHALPSGLVALGEVGLAGEVRAILGVDRRLAEARRLGFTHAIIPAHSEFTPRPGLEVFAVDSLRAAQAITRTLPPDSTVARHQPAKPTSPL